MIDLHVATYSKEEEEEIGPSTGVKKDTIYYDEFMQKQRNCNIALRQLKRCFFRISIVLPSRFVRDVPRTRASVRPASVLRLRDGGVGGPPPPLRVTGSPQRRRA